MVARPSITAHLGKESKFFAGRTLNVEVSGINLGQLQPIDVGVGLQVTPELNSGGVEQATLDANRALVGAGARSVVASEGGRLEQRLIDDGGLLVRLPVASKNPFTILSNAGRLAAIARREGANVIHVRSRAPALSALMAARH